MDETRGHEHVSGTRDELIADLKERADHWHHMASDKKRDRALEAAQGLSDGSFSVRVGNRIYSVTDAPQTAVPGQSAGRDENADTRVEES